MKLNAWAITAAKTLTACWVTPFADTLQSGKVQGDAQTQTADLQSHSVWELELLCTKKGPVELSLDWTLVTPLEETKNLKMFHAQAFIDCGPILEWSEILHWN